MDIDSFFLPIGCFLWKLSRSQFNGRHLEGHDFLCVEIAGLVEVISTLISHNSLLGALPFLHHKVEVGMAECPDAHFWVFPTLLPAQVAGESRANGTARMRRTHGSRVSVIGLWWVKLTIFLPGSDAEMLETWLFSHARAGKSPKKGTLHTRPNPCQNGTKELYCHQK